MSVFVLGVLWSVALSSTPLDEAQRAFQEGHYEKALTLAHQATQPPAEGMAWYWVGLSYFRLGQHAAALDALTKAEKFPDAPDVASLRFNQAACFFELGKWTEAEAAFAQAAESPTLAPLATLQAGWAALESGEVEKARSWVQKAKEAHAGEAVLELETQLDDAVHAEASTSYEQALVAFDQRHFSEAREGFLKASSKAPQWGAARMMAGAAAWRLGLRQEAQAHLQASLQLDLTTEQQQTAREYMERLSLGLRGVRRGWQLEASALGGVDTNVQQTGVAQRELFVPLTLDTASSFLDASVVAAHRSPVSSHWVTDVSYLVVQRAFGATSAEDYSLQVHRLMAQAEREEKQLRLGMAVWGEALFTGLSNFRGLTEGAGASAWSAYEFNREWISRLSTSVGFRDAWNNEFYYLKGWRWNVTASQQWRKGPWLAGVWAQMRDEALGTLTQTADTSGLPLLCRGTCRSAFYVLPFAFWGTMGGLEGRYVWENGMSLRLDADVERRSYADTTRLELTDALGRRRKVGEKTRVDVRWSAAAQWTIPISWVELAVRYEFVVNQSNVDTRLTDDAGACGPPNFNCHAFDATDANYVKHLLGVSATTTF